MFLERRYFYHGRRDAGYKCYLVAYNSGDGAVVMTNSDNADARRRDIISTIAYEYKWPDFQTKPHRLFSMSSALFALGIATVEKPPIPRLLRRVVDV